MHPQLGTPAVPRRREASGVPDREDVPGVGRRVVAVPAGRHTPTYLVCGHVVFPFPDLWYTVPPAANRGKP